MKPEEMAVCMGFDAMRLCLGHPPQTFTSEEVIRWIALMQATEQSRATTTVKNDAAKCLKCGASRLSIPRMGIVASCLLDPSKSVFQCSGMSEEVK